MLYYIWDRERNQWWRARGCGYTSNLNDAGKYIGDEALTIIQIATPPGQTVIVPESQKNMQIWGASVPSKVDTEESLIIEYEEWVKKNHLQEFDGDAQEMAMQEWLTDAQRAWLVDFIKRWEVTVGRDL